jgi:hypothetical protein
MATILIDSQAELRSIIEQDVPKVMESLKDSSLTVRESATIVLGRLIQYRESR